MTAAIAAIGAIGLDVGGLAVALVVGGHVTGPGPLAPLRRKAWRQALVAALACARLAERRGLDRQEGFVCGLLHDVGRVVALATFETVLAHTHDVRTLPAAAWEAAMNRFHVDLGLITARHWRLPSSLSTVVASHHRPELAGRHREMSELVLVADAIAELLELQARVLPAELAAAVAAAGPGGDGQELVSRLLSELPAFVAAVEEATAADTRPDHRSLPRSQIQSVPLALTGTPRPASFSVQVARASGPLAYRSSYVTADGIALTGPEPLPEHTLARLRIAAPWPIEVWATVVLCSPEGDTHRIEARLYAAEPRAQAAWDGFLARLA